MVPLTFTDEGEYDHVEQGDELEIADLHRQLGEETITIHNRTRDRDLKACHKLTRREIEVIRAGGMTNWVRNRRRAQ